MNALDLFCGAVGGWSCGIGRAGIRTVAACEIDPWRRAVFQTSHPDARMYEDVREVSATRLLADLGYLPDIIVGSPPCQDISAANTKGQGIDGDRSGLFWEALRLVDEIRPVWLALENSPGLRTLGYDALADELEEIGYACWPLVVGARHVGANHRRDRVWIIAADADRLELREQPGRRGGANRACAAIAGEYDPDADRARHPIGPSLAGDDGEELPDALRDIGRAWPHWNGGLAGLAAACAAAGVGPVDDGRPAILAPSLRNRAIAALGDAVVPKIPEIIARVMAEMTGT